MDKDINETMFAADLRLFRMVMTLSNDSLIDALQFLDRPNLDVVQITTKQFRDLVGNKLAHVCLRRLKSATVVRPIGADLIGKLYVTIMGPLLSVSRKALISPVEHAGKDFADLIASSYVERLYFEGVHLNDRLLSQMKASAGLLLLKSKNNPISSYKPILSRHFHGEHLATHPRSRTV